MDMLKPGCREQQCKDRITESGRLGNKMSIIACSSSSETSDNDSSQLEKIKQTSLSSGLSFLPTAGTVLREESVTRKVGGKTSTKENKTYPHHFISSLLSGVGSGALSSIACAPLDLIRTRMQVMGDVHVPNVSNNSETKAGHSTKIFTRQHFHRSAQSLSVYRAIRDVIATDGIKGCFRGLGATLVTVPTFWGMYFPLYELAKRDLHHIYLSSSATSGFDMSKANNDDVRVMPQVHMASAILAGSVADFFCNPLFVVRTRMQTEALHYLELPVSDRMPHGILSTTKRLYAEGGVEIFWRGFTASLLGLSHVAIQFPVYEWLKAEARIRSASNQESPLDLLFASAFSKMCATTITYPHEVLRSRMMDYRVPKATQKSIGEESVEKVKSGLMMTLKRIVAKEGWSGLYTGIHVSLLRVLPNCCITFMTYELILRWAKDNFERDVL